MRHRVFGNHLGRNTKQAKALYRSLVTALLVNGKIETSLAKAKAVQGMIDRIINFGKKNTAAARREVVKTMGKDALLTKIFKELAPRFSDRNSGYTRIVRLGQRFSDTAERVFLELVEGVEPIKVETKDTSSGTQEKKMEKGSERAKIRKPNSVGK